MEKGTVKRRIFLSNALMVLVTLLIFLAINLAVVKIYAESVEKELKTSIEDLIDGSGTSNFSDSDNVKYQHKDGRELLGDLDDFLESWTIHRNEFILFIWSRWNYLYPCTFTDQPDFHTESGEKYYGASGPSGTGCRPHPAQRSDNGDPVCGRCGI